MALSNLKNKFISSLSKGAFGQKGGLLGNVGNLSATNPQRPKPGNYTTPPQAFPTQMNKVLGPQRPGYSTMISSGQKQTQGAPNPNYIGNRTLTPKDQYINQQINSGNGFNSQGSQANNINSQANNSTSSQSSSFENKPDTTKNAYIEYLKTQFNPEQAKLAQENLNATNQRIADEIARNRENVKAIQANKQGQLASGQNYDASEESRKSNASLADLAIAKGYNADILKQYTDAGATLYEAEQAAAKEGNKTLSLEESQTLGVPFGTTYAEARKMGIVPSSGGEGFTLSENQMRFDANGNLISQNMPASGQGGQSLYQQERAQRTLDSVDELTKLVNNKTVGFGSLLKGVPRTASTSFNSQLQTLKAAIAFNELTAMREASKTGGALGSISERELTLLESALAGLSTKQTPEQFKAQLQKVKDSINRWSQATGGSSSGSSTGGGGMFNW